MMKTNQLKAVALTTAWAVLYITVLLVEYARWN